VILIHNNVCLSVCFTFHPIYWTDWLWTWVFVCVGHDLSSSGIEGQGRRSRSNAVKRSVWPRSCSYYSYNNVALSFIRSEGSNGCYWSAWSYRRSRSYRMARFQRSDRYDRSYRSSRGISTAGTAWRYRTKGSIWRHRTYRYSFFLLSHNLQSAMCRARSFTFTIIKFAFCSFFPRDAVMWMCKSQPKDDKPSLIGAWSGHVTHYIICGSNHITKTAEPKVVKFCTICPWKWRDYFNLRKMNEISRKRYKITSGSTKFQ